jgi:integrase/recombinase XerD
MNSKNLPQITPTLSKNEMNWCKIRYEARKSRKGNGLLSLRLCVHVNGQRIRRDLGISIPSNLWDQTNQVITGKSKQVHEARFMVEGEHARVYQILVDMHLSNAPKTIQEFLNRYESKTERTDFIKFFDERAKDNWHKGVFSDGTYNHYKVVSRRMKMFSNGRKLSFMDINIEWITRFVDFYNREIKVYKNGQEAPTAVNTIANAVKKIKATIKEAEVFGIVKHNQIKHFKVSTAETQRSFLSVNEFLKLIELYRNRTLEQKPTLHGVLRNFILMGSTGMRISDLKKVTKKNIKEDMLIYIAHKTRKHNKEVRIPLNNISKEVINDIETESLFFNISEQKQNMYLKEIAIIAEITYNITQHTARHTFASIFLEKGGKLEMLQSLLAHSSIATTMKYVHLQDDERKRQVKNAFDF